MDIPHSHTCPHVYIRHIGGFERQIGDGSHGWRLIKELSSVSGTWFVSGNGKENKLRPPLITDFISRG